MNQPKFKFGDIVGHGDKKFTVWTIHYSEERGSFYYKDEFSCSELIEEAYLFKYQEPVKRKLYAYQFENGEFKLFDSLIIPYKGNQPPRRKPEYDIEYYDA